MRILCEALRRGENKRLETLRLQYNEIDGKGVGLLYDIMKQGALPALRRVELNGNKFSEDDARVAKLRALLEERRREAGANDGEEGGEWGLDEFSDLEEESDEEEEEEEEEEVEEGERDDEEKEREAKAEEMVRDAEEEEGRNVSQKEDKDVDALAERLGKTDM
ncbi:MAG: hypothetical protein LQ341_007746, partial [Variospora aurantia]